MPTYTPLTNFGAKDSLPENDPDKVVRGLDFTNEFQAISAALAQAAENNSPDLDGDVTINGAYTLPDYLGNPGDVLSVTNDNDVDWLPGGSGGFAPEDFRAAFKPDYADSQTNLFANVYIYVGADVSAAPAPDLFRQYNGQGEGQDYAAKFTDLDAAFEFITDTDLTTCFDSFNFVNSKAQWVVVCAAETIALGNSSPLLAQLKAASSVQSYLRSAPSVPSGLTITPMLASYVMLPPQSTTTGWLLVPPHVAPDVLQRSEPPLSADTFQRTPVRCVSLKYSASVHTLEPDVA